MHVYKNAGGLKACCRWRCDRSWTGRVDHLPTDDNLWSEAWALVAPRSSPRLSVVFHRWGSVAVLNPIGLKPTSLPEGPTRECPTANSWVPWPAFVTKQSVCCWIPPQLFAFTSKRCGVNDAAVQKNVGIRLNLSPRSTSHPAHVWLELDQTL